MRLLLAFLVAQNVAADPGSTSYYSTDTVAQKSQIFRSYAEELGPNFDRLQQALGRAGQSLEQLELGVLLVGERGGEELKVHLDASRRKANHAFLVAQKHVSLLETDSQQVFEQAMAAVVSTYGDKLVECTQPSGMGSFGPARSQKSCEGKDRSAEIAAQMDKDADLKKEVDSILAVEWPSFAVESKALDAVDVSTSADAGTSKQTVSVVYLAQTFLADELAEIEAQLERSLAPIQRELRSAEEGRRAELIEQANGLRQAYESAMSEAGERLFGAMEKPLKKKKITVAVCPNPASMGGCPGEDVTSEVIEVLKKNKRFQKALR